METLIVCLLKSGSNTNAFGPFSQREASRFVQYWNAEGFEVETVQLNTSRCIEFCVKRTPEH
jgi:hypothetical protein